MKEEIRKLVEETERKAEGNRLEISYKYTDSEAARHARELCAAIREMDAEQEKERAAWRKYKSLVEQRTQIAPWDEAALSEIEIEFETVEVDLKSMGAI